MDTSSGRSPLFDDASPREERAGIFGLETEYVIVYRPDSPEDETLPPFAVLERVIVDSLGRITKLARSGGVKGGYFLQNGGLIHFEIFVRHQGDTPILEAATPECRTPRDALVWSRAFDELLEEISDRSRDALGELGYRGAVAFGKNNLDSHGTGFGSHENYLVHLRCTRAARIAFLLMLPALLVCLTPAISVFLVALVAISVYLVAWRLLRCIPFAERLGHGIVDLVRRRERLRQNALAVYFLSSNLLLYPAIALYRSFLRRTAFRPLVRHLTSLIVTRSILTGSGSLNFRERVYEISQRASLTRHVSTVVMFGGAKTIYDLKSLLYDPLSFFRPTQRLAITCGDSNLTDLPGLLKVGMAALIIEMIEEGETFEDLRLADPIRAFRDLSLGGPWKQLRMADGRTLSAVDVQRAYLDRARERFAGRLEDHGIARDILGRWEDGLERLDRGPQGLVDRADWVAKKVLLDRAILAGTDWKVFFAWGHVLDLAGLQSASSASSLEELVRRAPRRRRRALRRQIRAADLREEEFADQRELHFQARKIDLRYHELGCEPGYQRRLEADELLLRLTEDEEVRRATFDPPCDTRARIRGYYIRLSPSPDSLRAAWHEVELQSPMRHIPLPDPFFHRLPGDE